MTEISAASILDKITRDREMIGLDRAFPAYVFMQHKGYLTAFYLEQRAVLEATEHRRSAVLPL